MINAEIGISLNKAKEFLDNGNCIGLPTETVYGLAANALEIKPVLDIFRIKNRPDYDPLIIHLPSIANINTYASFESDKLKYLAEKLSPGPITFLLNKKEIIPDIVTSGLQKVAVRIPNHPMALELLNMIDYPLAAPSANPFGYISPTSSKHVFDQLGSKIPYILNGGDCEVGLESTIVGEENGKIKIYRKGGITTEQIEKILGEKVIMNLHSDSNPAAPGMLKKHYSPNKTVEIINEFNWPTTLNNKVGYLSFSHLPEGFTSENYYILSKERNTEEAAKNLFSGLRYLDSLDIDKIYIELLPETGLGSAINDRLKRAAASD